MLDRFREMEQRGAQCTQMDDHVRCIGTTGNVYEFYPDGDVRYHGARVATVQISMAEVAWIERQAGRMDRWYRFWAGVREAWRDYPPISRGILLGNAVGLPALAVALAFDRNHHSLLVFGECYFALGFLAAVFLDLARRR